jgi:Phasin protein
MSKRKPATASKHARSPKIAAKAQRATQAIVRSPKDSRLRSVAAGSTESPPKRHNDAQQEAPPLVENPATALQDACKQTMTDNDSKKGFDFSSATANVRAYQAKLLEMAQANMQFAFEFGQRLATIRSPVETFSVIAEFTSKRMAMFRKYSKEMAELRANR